MRHEPGAYDQEVLLTREEFGRFLPRIATPSDFLAPTIEIVKLCEAAQQAMPAAPSRRRKQGYEAALAGNPVPRRAAVSVLLFGPAERISAVVEIKHLGIWVLGDLIARRHDPGVASQSPRAAAGGRDLRRIPPLPG